MRRRRAAPGVRAATPPQQPALGNKGAEAGQGDAAADQDVNDTPRVAGKGAGKNGKAPLLWRGAKRYNPYEGVRRPLKGGPGLHPKASGSPGGGADQGIGGAPVAQHPLAAGEPSPQPPHREPKPAGTGVTSAGPLDRAREHRSHAPGAGEPRGLRGGGGQEYSPSSVEQDDRWLAEMAQRLLAVREAVAKDGNCQYTGLAVQCAGWTAASLRAAVVETLGQDAERRATYAPDIDDPRAPPSYDDYIAAQAQSGVYGDGATLRVAAEVLGPRESYLGRLSQTGGTHTSTRL